MPKRELRISLAEPNLAKVAALMGDPVRARMLFSLMGGREVTASELAMRAGCSPQAASAHLSKLVEGGLLLSRRVGRQRLFQISSQHVAGAIETLTSIAPQEPIVSLSQQKRLERLRNARSCYDHLAGRLGVSVAESLVERQVLAVKSNSFQFSTNAESFLAEIGIDVAELRERRRTLVRACWDWSEQRWHLAGGLGAAVLDLFLETKWLVRTTGDRSLQITPAGQVGLKLVFGTKVVEALQG
jgi:DNA-binding transcriptional ArsR family regulator